MIEKSQVQIFFCKNDFYGARSFEQIGSKCYECKAIRSVTIDELLKQLFYLQFLP